MGGTENARDDGAVAHLGDHLSDVRGALRESPLEAADVFGAVPDAKASGEGEGGGMIATPADESLDAYL